MQRATPFKTAYLCFFCSIYGLLLPVLGCGDGHVESTYAYDDLDSISRKLQEEDKAFESCACDLQVPNDANLAVMGLPRRTFHVRLMSRDIKKLPTRALTVPVEMILEAQSRIPEQNDGWSCGINSAARFAVMLGAEIGDYNNFLKNAPHYGGFLLPKIGVNPEGIQNYLQNQKNISAFSIRQKCTRVFHPQWKSMMQSLSFGWPTMFLIMHSGTSLHWLNIVARDKSTGNWIYLDTNGEVREILGGDEELKHWMNHGNCAAQRFNFVERFNTVFATGYQSSPYLLAEATSLDVN